MKKTSIKLLVVLVILISIVVSACSRTDTALLHMESESDSVIAEADSVLTDTDPYASSEISTENSSRILIAYFTWGENTHVENPDQVDVDATTSASVLAPGNTGKIAGWIQEMTGGEIYKIVTVHQYSSDYDTCLEEAADEKADRARPELVGAVENLDDYDIVFLGYPNWWYTAPMAMFSFIEAHDLSGKTVIPFVSHGTGGLSRCIKDIEDALPESVEVLDPIGVYRRDVDTSRDAVENWLREIGMID